LFRLNTTSGTTEPKILCVFPSDILTIEISSTGQYLAAFSGFNDDGTGYGHVLDLETGTTDLFLAPFHPRCLVFSPDGNFLAMHDFRSLTVWDVRARKVKFSRNCSPSEISGVAFEPKTDNLYISRNGMFEIWKPDGTLGNGESRIRPDLEDNEERKDNVNDCFFGGIQFSPDGDVLVRTTLGRIELYRLDSGIPQGEVFMLNLRSLSSSHCL
jgi:WD40 repeat protein